MERMASSGSIKRASYSGSSMGLSSPGGSTTTLSIPDDSFSNKPEDYEIRSAIGYGSSAVVYNAYYKPLSKRVAIKVIDLDMFERNQIDELRRETQVMALCKHPNVLRVNGAFVTESKLYIVTPYLSAGSCLDIMKTAYPDGLEEIAIATILKQALQGLDYLHKNGHIHRDVKAGNLLVDDDGSVMLADFGVSSSLMENGDRRGMRKTFVGTPCWMAPEVMEQAGYDYKADIWSFGITAIELATGHAPFAKYPPIKVLMLTLSNDPPTLDREHTKHRYSKLFKEMIDICLQKDPTRRPTAEKLLGHAFFKQAKKKSYLVTGLLHNLPPLEQRPQKKATQKQIIPEKGVSWDFDADDSSRPGSELPSEDRDSERRPRTVTFDTSPSRPLSVATIESASSAATTMTPSIENISIEPRPEEPVSSQGSTPVSSHTGDKPVKKSRFVVEDTSVNSTALSSPVLAPTSELRVAQPAPSPTPSSSSSAQATPQLQGLGMLTGVEQTNLPEVKKGRFSVKDTSSGGSSPLPPSIKTMPGEPHLSLSRSQSSSPIDAIPDGVRVNIPTDPMTPSERRSRFEVHHAPNAPVYGVPVIANGAGATLASPAVTSSATLSRESSQSRAGGESGLSRDNSLARASRFSVEGSAINSEGSSVSPSSVPPVASSGSSSIQAKRSRFQISTVEGTRPSSEHTSEGPGSLGSTPTTSPTGSLLRGQPALLETLGAHTVHGNLESLYRQNEQQRAILNELFASFGLKAGPLSGTGRAAQETAVVGVGSGHVAIGSNSGSVHRGQLPQQLPLRPDHGPGGHASLERQLQVAARENDTLRRENETLKREIERLRRGGQ
ncbi:hypothetical protein BGW38_001723 [Lunasporangiospora selenospora]|uniref:Protein kinase domain-containing protein n=1 Tax=Lunasporangiospora selenospora TaxID=979761 RepID=A0A9P6FTQ2_9FUNG|nr:hypothetical protein BGW38_001723 [Lunasporangiospora selenospora]